MKLIRLTIHNIASIEDAVIDFEGDVLAGKPIFLITGPTGAGKSTLLDSICLALYDSTPRLANASKDKETYEDSSFKKGLDASKDLQLIRKNADEAFAKLTFEGIDGIAYTATWSAAKGKITKVFDTSKHRLEWVEAGLPQTLEKSGEVKERIVKATGLQFDEFCKTTMLAQGEFTRFLKSDKREKAEILEKITGTDIYARIGKKIYDRHKECKEKLDRLRESIADIKLLTDEEIADIKAQIEQSNAQIINATKQTAILQKQKDWRLKEQELDKELALCSDKLKDAQQTFDSEEVKEKKKTLDLWKASDAIRQDMTLLNNELSEKKKLTSASDFHKAHYTALLGQLAFRQQLCKDRQDAMTKEDELLRSFSGLEEMLKQSQSITTTLNAIVSAKAYIGQQTERQKSQSALLMEKKADEKKRREALKDADDRLAKLANEIKSKEDEKQGADTAAVNTSLDNIKNALTKLKELSKDKENLRQTNADLASTMEQKAALEKLMPDLADTENKAKKALETADANLTNATRLKGPLKAILAGLKKGDTCPVCGGTVSKYNADKELETTIALFAKEKDNEARAYNEAMNKLAKARADIAAKENEILSLRKKLNQQQAETDRNASEARRLVALCNTAWTEQTDELSENIKQLEDSTTRTRDALVKIDKEIAQLRSKLDTAGKEKDNAQKELEKLARQTADCESELKSCQNLIDSRTKDIDNNWKSIESLIAYPEWTKDNPNALAQSIATDAEKLNNATNRRTELEKEVENIKKDIASSETSLEKVRALTPKWATLTATPVRADSEIAPRWTELSTQIEAWVKNIKDKTEKAKELDERIQQFFSENPTLARPEVEALMQRNDRNALEEAVRKVAEELVMARSKKEKAEEQRKSHAEQRPDGLTDEQTAETLQRQIDTLSEQTQRDNQTIGQLKQVLRNDDANRKNSEGKQRELKETEATFAKWDSLNNDFGDATGSKFRQIAQSFIMREMMHHSNTFLRNLTGNRFTLESQPGSLVFLIRDAYNGNTPLSPTNLSGGESFMVSLALALGLSSISSQRGLNTGTIFIDEGFGTLDNDYLNKVMYMLERLQEQTGCQVGIISHVDELKERIPVQIRVNKIDNSRSEIEIVEN